MLLDAGEEGGARNPGRRPQAMDEIVQGNLRVGWDALGHISLVLGIFDDSIIKPDCRLERPLSRYHPYRSKTGACRL